LPFSTPSRASTPAAETCPNHTRSYPWGNEYSRRRGIVQLASTHPLILALPACARDECFLARRIVVVADWVYKPDGTGCGSARFTYRDKPCDKGVSQATMDSRTRMFKTLGVLAGTMTACAMFLAWIAPPDADVTILTRPEPVRDGAAAAVDTLEDATLAPWRSVDITSASGSPMPGVAALSATRSGSFHFRVSRYGHVHAESPWRRQVRLGPRHRVVIGLSGIEQGEPLPLAQWVGLRTLLATLENRLLPPNERIAVTIESLIAQESPQLAQDLRDLVGQDGYAIETP